MMSYIISPYVLVRTPAGDLKDYSKGPQFFLDNSHFLCALLLASPVVFMALEKHNFRAEAMTDKERMTLKKYINRFCFRPTPFGLFAAVSLSDWVNGPETKDLPAKYYWNCRADMSFNNLIAGSVIINPDSRTFEINPTIYRVLQEFRFIRTWVDAMARHREYQLQAIAYSGLLRDLIAYCRTPRLLPDIYDQIAKIAHCTLSESVEYTDFLIDAQLLLSCNRLNITGDEQLNRIENSLVAGDLKTALQKLKVMLQSLPQKRSYDQVFAIQEIQREMTALLPENSGNPKSALSIILSNRCPSGGPRVKFQNEIIDGVTALKLLSEAHEMPAMTNFVKTFQKHFEGQTIPLLAALDPEAGIGYQQPLTIKNNPLLETLNIPYKRGTASHGAWSERHALLLAAWLRDGSRLPVIKLELSDLQKLKEQTIDDQIIGMSVLFRISGEKVYMENTGGINAPALMGRFTVADESIREAAIDMARVLETQNPDVIFAELLHLADPHTDNVNTRSHIYRYEIPITGASTLPEEQQIPLSDLHICIAENKVILFSEKHQKIVLPRLTSAYNHSLSKLPLFRFLADLPYQFGQYRMELDLRQFFPGQQFYPRVEFQQTILALATWVIGVEHLNILKQAGRSSIESFNTMSQEIRLPRYFFIAEGDQELVIDSNREEEVRFFCECVRLKTEVVIKEFLEQSSIRQYNCYLLPQKPLILPKFSISNAVKNKRKFIAGSEWLYLKIYAPQVGADRLLLRMRSLIGKHYSHGRIREWFFIRYDDHAPHIRLRLRVVPEDIGEILLAFKAKLQNHIHQHLIREYQVDIYSRELERYAYAGIEKTESFFHASSELVVSFLKQNRKGTIVSVHAFALCSTLAMIAEFIGTQSEQAVFTKESYQQFLPEFADKSFKVELDKKYRELTPGIFAALTNKDPGLFSGSLPAGTRFLKSLKSTHVKPGSAKVKDAYLRSLIHMHLNRIFTDETRKQEMIIYYLLHKHLLSVQARAGKTSASQSATGSLLQDVHP